MAKRKTTKPKPAPKQDEGTSLSASSAGIECPRALWMRLHRAPDESPPPEATKDGTAAHKTIEADLVAKSKTHKNLWGKVLNLTPLYPPDDAPFLVEQAGHFDFDLSDGRSVRVNLVIDLLRKGAVIDHKSAYDEASDSYGRKLQRMLYAYYVLTHLPEWADDGGVTTYNFFLRHGSLIKHERYTLKDIPAIEAQLRQRFLDCLEVYALPAPPRERVGFCEFCAYSVSCPQQEVAKVISTKEAWLDSVREYKKARARASALERLCKMGAQQWGEADLGGGERWGKRVSQSLKVDAEALFRHGCACEEAHCLGWVMRAFTVDRDEVRRLAKGDEGISALVEVADGGARWGFYRADKQEES